MPSFPGGVMTKQHSSALVDGVASVNKDTFTFDEAF